MSNIGDYPLIASNQRFGAFLRMEKIMLKSIIQRMVKLWRQWRFVRLVNKKNKLIGYKDPDMVGFFDGEEFKFESEDSCIKEFKVYTRNKTKKKYIAERTCEASKANKFIKQHNDGGLVRLEVTPVKGDNFIEGLGILGYIRELHTKDKNLIAFVFSVVTFAVGLYLGKGTM